MVQLSRCFSLLARDPSVTSSSSVGSQQQTHTVLSSSDDEITYYIYYIYYMVYDILVFHDVVTCFKAYPYVICNLLIALVCALQSND